MIGITERGDAALDIGWLSWIKDGKPAILITKDPETLHSRLHGYASPSRKSYSTTGDSASMAVSIAIGRQPLETTRDYNVPRHDS